MTRHRHGGLDADLHAHCRAAVRKACGDPSAQLRELNGQDNHMHLLAGYPTQVPAAAQGRGLAPGYFGHRV